MRPLREIIIHCSATPEGVNFKARDIRVWHRERGFADIGYHYIVLLDGTVEEGRVLEKIGAHCRGRNAGTIGICYIGGVQKDGKTPKDTRTPAQRASLLKLCRDLVKQYPSIKRISGHNQYANKACPSFDVRKDALGKLIKSDAANA